MEDKDCDGKIVDEDKSVSVKLYRNFVLDYQLFEDDCFRKSAIHVLLIVRHVVSVKLS